MNLTSPNQIVFDLDHTLYDHQLPNKIAMEKLVEHLSNETSFPKDKIEIAYNAARISVKNSLGDTGSSHSRILYLNQMIRELGIKPKPSFVLLAEQIYWSNYLSQIDVRKGLSSFIQLARLHQIPIFLISDLTLQTQLRKLLRLKLDDAFDFIFTSEEIGGDKKTGKPAKLLDSLIKEVDVTWFFGDVESDFLIKNGVNTFFHMDSKSLRLEKNTISITDYEKPFEFLKKITNRN
jgi:FMN phosphatase YigB (HAD superfamily)